MIKVSQYDKDRLIKLIDDAKLDLKSNQYMKDLEKELSKAEVLAPEDMPPNIVRMNSRVLIRLDGEDEVISLVYPEEADARKNRISILSPLGTALIGYGEGESVEWKAPGGTIHIEVIQVFNS